MDKFGRLLRDWLLPDKALIAFCVILLSMVWAAALWQIEQDRQTTVKGVMQDGDKFTRAFEEHVRTVLKPNEQILGFMKNEYEKAHAVTPALASLFAHLRADPQIIQAGIVDATGYNVISTLPAAPGINVADSPPFIAHKTADTGKTFIGRPLTGQVSKKLTLHLTRRVNNADGSFGGVAIVAIDPYYFSKFYQNMDFNENYTVRLLGLDGVIRVSNSPGETGYDLSQAALFREIAKQPAGFYYAPGTQFGKTGFRSYRVMADYPLVVQVGLSAKALGPLAQRRNMYLAAAGGTSLFIIWYTGRLVIRSRRQRRADYELQSSYGQLTAAHEELTANEEELRISYNALVNERAFTEAVLESVPGLLYLYDENGRIVRWNKNHETATGYSAEEMARMTLVDWYRYDEKTVERVYGAAGKAFDEGAANAELYLQNKDGSKTPYYFTAVRTMIDNKPYIAGIGIDVSERIAMESTLVEKEQELQRSLTELTASHEELRKLYAELQETADNLAAKEHQLRGLFEHMHDSFALHEVICDDEGRPADWRYLFVNEAFEKQSGRSRAELLGRTAREVTPKIVEEDWFISHGNVALTGEPLYTISYIRTTGKYFAVSIYSPEPQKFAIMAIDVTEQKKAENLLQRREKQLEESYEKLSALYEDVVAANEKLEHSRRTAEEIFQAAGDGFVVCDGESGDIVAVNRRLTEMFGYTAEEFKEQGVVLLSTPANLEMALATLRRAVAEGPQPLIEGETLDRYGNRLIIEISAGPVTIDGKTCCLALLRDVTVRKQLEEGLEYLRMRDPLTGVYNRTFFETEMLRVQVGDYDEIGMFVCDVDGLKLINDTLGHLQGDELLKKVAAILKSGVQKPDYVARIGGDEFAVVLFEPTKKAMEELDQFYRRAVEVYNSEAPYLPLSLSLGWATGASGAATEILFKEADNNMYRQKLHQSHSVRGSIVQTMMKALEERDHITEGHADRLGDLMESMGQKLQLPRGTLADLRLLAKFHDIGKVGIPDSILNKPGRLTNEELAVMRRHCEIGYRIAKASPDLEPIADWILKHQEWWNGNGYPLGIAAESIPLECRILAIVDAYDAMTNDRPYRKAMPPGDALAELEWCAGTQFDPQLVELFVSQAKTKP